MHLVDDVDLVFTLGGRISHLVPDLTNVVYAVVGGCVDFYYIHGSACRYRAAGRARSAGIAIHRVFTVHRPGEDLRNRCFSGTPGTAKQVGMSDSVCIDLIFQCDYNVILSPDVAKLCRPKLPVEGHIRHVFLPL